MSTTNTAQRLNQNCACTTLDRKTLTENLRQQMQGESGDELFTSPVWTQMFADSAVFVPEQDMAQMRAIIRAVEAAVELPNYQQSVMEWAPPTAAINPGPAGVFMGYDFHLGETGPQLIEVNSNAGGAFINAKLAHAQCCSGAPDSELTENFATAVSAMFLQEWRTQGLRTELKRIAIVDDDPQQQYLYPEFLLAQSLLRERGLAAVICSPEELTYRHSSTGGELLHHGEKVDLVYNRLVDFGLEQSANSALRQAWLQGTAVVTPNPRTHALYADKRNLVLLSDAEQLREWQLAEHHIANLLQAVPATQRVNPRDADALWQRRKQLFFKPVASHGSKGVYRGSKLTKRVFEEILANDYIAQAFVPPSERTLLIDGERHQLKVDVRFYTYRSEVLLTAARLYRGQATNFRTPGGGFAPVFTLPEGL